ncbi:hypothetical protein [Photobacterium damselae]|uniref:hypothetical protein n=1 Tax=Photobacterium damselae TaxID=38293 RepID=UPI00165D87BC|nr:hypothetical protein [Photobacterium damselae]
MYFIGYHGTSEKSAVNILNTGIRQDCLPKTGQIGHGFYVAKVKGALPEWGTEQATSAGRSKLSIFQKTLNNVLGEKNNIFLPNEAKRTILKIYSTKYLAHCNWNPMNPVDLSCINEILKETPQSRDSMLNHLIKERSKWLQMVIAPEDFKYIIACRDDGKKEKNSNWFSKEAPF